MLTEINNQSSIKIFVKKILLLKVEERLSVFIKYITYKQRPLHIIYIILDQHRDKTTYLPVLYIAFVAERTEGWDAIVRKGNTKYDSYIFVRIIMFPI